MAASVSAKMKMSGQKLRYRISTVSFRSSFAVSGSTLRMHNLAYCWVHCMSCGASMGDRGTDPERSAAWSEISCVSWETSVWIG